jgi:hypothetical protein
MEELFIETKDGNIPIDPAIVKRFNLEKGTWSPFTRSRIVGKNGEFPEEKDSKNNGKNIKAEDTAAETQNGGVVLTTSEVIDFAHGEDSSNEH